MKKSLYLYGIGLVALLSGCTSIRQAEPVTVIDEPVAIARQGELAGTITRGDANSAGTRNPAMVPLSAGYASWYNRYNGANSGTPVNRAMALNSVVKGMAEQLLASGMENGQHDPIAITSIVNLDDLANTNWLGQTLSEGFIHELHIRKVPVIDYKVTGSIKVMKSGDFALSRDWQELNPKVPVYRVLTGTMSRTDEGVMLNTRIIDMSTGLVEASAVGFIPNNLLVGGLNSLGPVDGRGGYLIRQGVPYGYKGRMVQISH